MGVTYDGEGRRKFEGCGQRPRPMMRSVCLESLQTCLWLAPSRSTNRNQFVPRELLHNPPYSVRRKRHRRCNLSARMSVVRSRRSNAGFWYSYGTALYAVVGAVEAVKCAVTYAELLGDRSQ